MSDVKVRYKVANTTYLDMYNNVNVPIFIKDKKTGIVLFSNDCLNQLLGYNFTGKDSRVFIPEDNRALFSDMDDIPDTDLTPWMGFVYTFPDYRGRRLTGKLISRVREKAREDGFDNVYISTGETGLYEKYGASFYTTLKDRNGADSRIYRLEAYGFAGWEKADAPAVTDEYRGIRTPRDLYNALWHVWSAETCAPRMRGDWSGENRTLGQCSVTAFLAQDIFGGKVYGIPLEDGSVHCYNVAGGRTFDLTSEQFGGKKLDYGKNPEQLRYEHFRKEEKRARYEKLKADLKARTG
jgi:GNAT superfamily N-acetyltransferase